MQAGRMIRKLAIADHCNAIAEHFEAALAEQGQHTMRSFDLQSARAASLQECPCPHHHTSDCSCQYVVLIVYMTWAEQPRAVVLHEFEGITRITLDDPDGRLTGLLLEQEKESA
jgi:hypothetical protein